MERCLVDQVGTEQERKKEEEGFEGRSSSDGQVKRDSDGRIEQDHDSIAQRREMRLINSIMMVSL